MVNYSPLTTHHSGIGVCTIEIRFNIRRWVEEQIVFFVLLYRRLRYGYPFRRIPLTRGKFAIVDPEDYNLLSRCKWCAVKDSNTYYAVRSRQNKQIRMHREIMKVPKHLVCDHINHNGLDNRKNNLRICTKQQNTHNQKPRKTGTSKYKGVDWNKRQRKWRARIYYESRCHYLGYFNNEIDAAKAYDKKARELFKEFACLNFTDVK